MIGRKAFYWSLSYSISSPCTPPFNCSIFIPSSARQLVKPQLQNEERSETENTQDQLQKDAIIEKRGTQGEDGASSESGDSESESESSSNSSSETANQESETEELQLLGNIKSKGDDSLSNKQEARRKRKRKTSVRSASKQTDLRQEEISHIRNVHRIHVYGTDIPEACDSFDKLSDNYRLHPKMIENIKSVGYVTPTPIQIQAIPVMLHRRDVMACAPTGSGKTAAFILPILHHLKEPRNEGIRALVLSPTRELAKQTYREFQRLSEGIGFKLLYIDKIGKDMQKLTKSSRKTDILVSTPNRLLYVLRQSPPVVSLSNVQWLVVDESDKLFEDGKTGFRDQVATCLRDLLTLCVVQNDFQLGAIYKACDGSNVRRAMFSATFAFDVEEWCKLNLDNVIQVYIGARNTATQSIEQSLTFVGSETGKLLAIRDMIRQGIQPPVLVFVQSKERAKDLFHELIYDGMNVDVIHAERTQLQRDNVVKSFRSGKIWILICTELMGRGIDFKGVNLVINYDFPNSAISYIHRIGRTGRAGRTGKAVTFFTEDDAVNLRSIANVMRSAGCPVPDYMLKINKPSKKIRRKLAKSVPKRAKISTVTKYDLQKAKQKRRLVEDHKKKDGSLQSGNLSVTNQSDKQNDNESGSSETDRKKRKRNNETSTEIPYKKKKFNGAVRQKDKKLQKPHKQKLFSQKKRNFNAKTGKSKGFRNEHKKKKKKNQKET